MIDRLLLIIEYIPILKDILFIYRKKRLERIENR